MTRLALLLILAAALPARAADCAYTDAEHTHVLCTAEGYTLLVDANARLAHDLADQIAAVDRCGKELDAAHVHVAALEGQPASPLGYLLAFGGGVALVVGLLLVVH